MTVASVLWVGPFETVWTFSNDVDLQAFAVEPHVEVRALGQPWRKISWLSQGSSTELNAINLIDEVPIEWRMTAAPHHVEPVTGSFLVPESGVIV